MQIARKILKILNLDVQAERALYSLGLRRKLYREKSEKILELYKPFISSGKLVFDIGANIGNFSEAFLQLGAKVICVEPQNSCYGFLKTRFRKNKNIILLKTALDSSESEKNIFISSSHTVSSMSEDWIASVKKTNRFYGAEWGKKERIKTITLDKMIEKYGIPYYCKIDVEGYEYNVLQGLHSRIPLISIEYSYEQLQETEKCLEHLERLGKIKVQNFSNPSDILSESAWKERDEVIQWIRMQPADICGDLFIKFA